MLKKIPKGLLSRDEGLLGKAATTLVVRIGSAVAAFVMNVAIARVLGAVDAGVFFLSLTVVMAASVITRFGMDNALMRFVSPAWERGDHARVVGVGVQGLGIVTGLGLVVSGGLYAGADFLAIRIFDDPGLAGTLHFMVLAIVPYSLIWVLSGMLKAVRLPAQANFVEAGAVPTMVGGVLAVLLMFETSASSETAASVYLVAAFLSVVLAVALFLRHIPKSERLIFSPLGSLVDSALPLFWVAVLNFSILWSSSLFLGIYADAGSVGLYNVAQRTAALISFILIVFNSITAPRFAALYSQGKLKELERLAVKTAWLMSVVACPLLVIVLAIPEWILSLFGPEFTSASMLLRIIAAGQFINVMTGSVGYLLMMTGNERLMRNNVALTAGISLVLNVLLVSRYGALGAAVTTAVCLAIQNVIAAWFVYKRLGIRTIPGWRMFQQLRVNLG